MSNHMGNDASRQKWFEAMLPFIPYCAEDADTWITGSALQAQASLSEHHRSAGINWARAHYCPDKEWALVSGRRGYRFVATVRQAQPFLVPRYKSAETLLRISYFGVQKPLINRAVASGERSRVEATVLEKSVTRALEDLRDLASMLG